MSETTITPPAPAAPVAERLPEEPAAPVEEPKKKRSAPNLKVPGIAKLFGDNPSAGVWAGLACTAVGFLLIFISWIGVARTLDVGRQMPYVVSGAMFGLGLIVVGIAVVDMAVRRQDRQERRHQIALLQHVLSEVRGTLESEKK